jgi:triosephosphate isomerase
VSGVHAEIHARLDEVSANGDAAPVIYGGSIDPSTAGPLLAARGVDGLFVGRSALRPEVFSEIAHARAE